MFAQIDLCQAAISARCELLVRGLRLGVMTGCRRFCSIPGLSGGQQFEPDGGPHPQQPAPLCAAASHVHARCQLTYFRSNMRTMNNPDAMTMLICVR